MMRFRQMFRFLTFSSLSFVAAVMFGFPAVALGAGDDVLLSDDPFRLAAGKWAWGGPAEQCRENPHYITFSSDRKTAYFRVDRPFMREGKPVSEYSYSILSSDGKSITMRMNDETRRTDNGDIVVWVFVLKDSRTYAWRRTDWEPSRLSADVVRCE